jgi:hypothetical protein
VPAVDAGEAMLELVKLTGLAVRKGTKGHQGTFFAFGFQRICMVNSPPNEPVANIAKQKKI